MHIFSCIVLHSISIQNCERAIELNQNKTLEIDSNMEEQRSMIYYAIVDLMLKQDFEL